MLEGWREVVGWWKSFCQKSEDGMVELFLFESLDFDLSENRRAPRRPSSEGAQSQCPNKKGQKLVEKSPFLC
jgi:hypothetical protein